MGDRKGRRGWAEQFHHQQSCPHTEPPRQAALLRVLQLCPLWPAPRSAPPSFTLPSRGRCLCASEVLLLVPGGLDETRFLSGAGCPLQGLGRTGSTCLPHGSCRDPAGGLSVHMKPSQQPLAPGARVGLLAWEGDLRSHLWNQLARSWRGAGRASMMSACLAASGVTEG